MRISFATERIIGGGAGFPIPHGQCSDTINNSTTASTAGKCRSGWTLA
jgi:hypothetical protein